MTKSALTNKTKISSQSSSRDNAKIDTFLIHHTASVSGRGDGIVNMMVNKSRQVSSNYVIGNDGYLWNVVDEDRRAWTSGSTADGGKGAAWDRRSITVEIVNQKGAPNWEISDAAITKAAQLLNDLRSRYNIKNVLGHRDLWTKHKASYATFCPGPNTVARIVKRAEELAGGITPSPAPKPKPATTPASQTWAFNPPSAAVQKRIQAALKKRGRYSGPVDGVWGVNSRKGIQATAKLGGGYTGPVDGIPGRNTCLAIQRYARSWGDYKGPIDGILGPFTWAGFALGLERP